MLHFLFCYSLKSIAGTRKGCYCVQIKSVTHILNGLIIRYYYGLDEYGFRNYSFL